MLLKTKRFVFIIIEHKSSGSRTGTAGSRGIKCTATNTNERFPLYRSCVFLFRLRMFLKFETATCQRNFFLKAPKFLARTRESCWAKQWPSVIPCRLADSVRDSSHLCTIFGSVHKKLKQKSNKKKLWPKRLFFFL